MATGKIILEIPTSIVYHPIWINHFNSDYKKNNKQLKVDLKFCQNTMGNSLSCLKVRKSHSSLEAVQSLQQVLILGMVNELMTLLLALLQMIFIGEWTILLL